MKPFLSLIFVSLFVTSSDVWALGYKFEDVSPGGCGEPEALERPIMVQVWSAHSGCLAQCFVNGQVSCDGGHPFQLEVECGEEAFLKLGISSDEVKAEARAGVGQAIFPGRNTENKVAEGFPKDTESEVLAALSGGCQADAKEPKDEVTAPIEEAEQELQESKESVGDVGGGAISIYVAIGEHWSTVSFWLNKGASGVSSISVARDRDWSSQPQLFAEEEKAILDYGQEIQKEVPLAITLEGPLGKKIRTFKLQRSAKGLLEIR